jgi:hypothetical protein
MTRFVPRVCLLAALVATTVFAQPTPIPQHFVFTLYRASGIYDVGDTVGWTVTPATFPPAYAFKWPASGPCSIKFADRSKRCR